MGWKKLVPFAVVAALLLPGIAEGAINGTNLNPLGAKVFTDTGKVGGIKCKDLLDSSGTCPIEVLQVDPSGNPTTTGLGATYASPVPSLSPGQSSNLVLDQQGNLKVNVTNSSASSSGLYASPLPTYAPGTSVQLGTDVNGLLVLSPSSTVGVNLSAAPAVTNRSAAVGSTSVTLMANNTSRRVFQVCNPYTVSFNSGSTFVANNQILFVNLLGIAAVVGPPSVELWPGLCYEPDAIPATSNSISAIASPMPGATATSIPSVEAFEQ